MTQGQAAVYGDGACASLRELALAAEERARSSTSETPTPIALWDNLVEGRWRLIERFQEDGRRYYVALQNPPGTSQSTALSPRERLLVGLVGAGESEKAAAYALGVGPSTLSGLLKGALAKLGMRSRTDLVMFMGAVGLDTTALAARTTSNE